jgi:hypothetical protein
MFGECVIFFIILKKKKKKKKAEFEEKFSAPRENCELE